jgi:PEGA domain
MIRYSKLLLPAVACLIALWPADLFAQRVASRAPVRSAEAGGRHVYRSYYPRYYYRPFYYSPFYYSPFYYGPYFNFFYGPYYSPFWGFYGQYPVGPYGPYPYYGPVFYDNTGSARLQVSPRNAQVYVDGYFVGVADDFDGTFQRLHVEAGEHELQFYLEGHRPFSQKVLFGRDSTLKVTHVMQPLGPGETSGPLPTPDPARRVQPSGGGGGQRPGVPSRPDPGDQSTFGSLLLRVRPVDADVFVDGESWTAPEGQDQFVIEVAEGPHRIEVRKEGYQTYSTTVRVRRGETVRLNVSLTTGGSSRAE